MSHHSFFLSDLQQCFLWDIVVLRLVITAHQVNINYLTDHNRIFKHRRTLTNFVGAIWNLKNVTTVYHFLSSTGSSPRQESPEMAKNGWWKTEKQGGNIKMLCDEFQSQCFSHPRTQRPQSNEAIHSHLNLLSAAASLVSPSFRIQCVCFISQVL